MKPAKWAEVVVYAISKNSVLIAETVCHNKIALLLLSAQSKTKNNTHMTVLHKIKNWPRRYVSLL